MPKDDVPLYVRLPADQAQRLNEMADLTGRSKRQLVGNAIRSHLEDAEGLVVGRASLSEDAPEILTLEEAAAFLRVDSDELRKLAGGGGIPARQIASEWRFSRAAVLEWLKRA